MDDMEEIDLGPYMPGFMNDGGDRVVEQQLIAAQEHHDIQGNDEQEHMAAYEMLGPYMRAAGALMDLNVGGMRHEAREAREDALEAVGEFSEGEDIFRMQKSQEQGTGKKGCVTAYFSCKCCPPSRFGERREDDTWSLDLHRSVGWRNPISMRLSPKEFMRTCRDHVGSKNGRRRFWETVDRVDKMLTSGSVSPPQQDRENLAA